MHVNYALSKCSHDELGVSNIEYRNHAHISAIFFIVDVRNTFCGTIQ